MIGVTFERGPAFGIGFAAGGGTAACLVKGGAGADGGLVPTGVAVDIEDVDADPFSEGRGRKSRAPARMQLLSRSSSVRAEYAMTVGPNSDSLEMI